MEDEAQPEPTVVEDPVKVVQEAISAIDPDSMCIGYACAIEWLEADGSTTFSVLHSPMPPWHLSGLLSYARGMASELYCPGEAVDDDEDDF